jgi:phosphoenolpyruvate-protein phosphotransferase (PTS system enzyme I)
MNSIKGISASYGVAIGPIFNYKRIELIIERYTIQDPDAEMKRFVVSKEIANQQLVEVYDKAVIENGAEQAEIFKAQAMILDDPELIGSTKKLIKEQKINLESAFFEVAEGFAGMLEGLDDEYLAARALDIRDVASRLLRILLGIAESPAENLNTPSIIIAKDLTPSDSILLDKSFILGFATALGGATSHTSILARGLGLPAVVGAGLEVLEYDDGEKIILDGDLGQILLDVNKQTLKLYQARQQKDSEVKVKVEKFRHGKTITKDGHQVEVAANIGNIEDAIIALDAGAEGVGLLRSEFLFLERTAEPTEEEQYQSYKAIADTFGEHPVVLRSLDVGGDKDIPYIDQPEEENPFLGFRAIRLCLDRPKLFKPQLRAALRAGYDTNLKLMFPMVATVEEVRQVREVLEECRAELKLEGQKVADLMEIGIMIEIPAAAIMADQLADEVDFFSIGTNDLAQYTLAADRTNSQVSQLASAFQPAVFRLIKLVIDSAHKKGKWVGLCGELAGELLAIPILLGLGLDEFSMNPPAIPFAKYLIRSITLKQAKEVAKEALGLSSIDEIREYVLDQVPEVNLNN